jgi:endonuclease/exonuclease/phosphatase family metal-dependent hydrolase
VTHLRFEKRGLLHCAVELPGLAQPLHCVCVHLSLFARSRRRQMDALARRIEEVVPADAPLLIAGDFNDWRNHADDLLAERLGLARSSPATAGGRRAAIPPRCRCSASTASTSAACEVGAARVHAGPPWSGISDHAALSAELRHPAVP